MATEPEETQRLRAQLLASEHAGLLSARTTIQSELLTRVTIFLTLVSAGLLSIALIGNATDFEPPFPQVAVVILAFEVTVGVLTQLRVINAAMDDMVLVLGLNRIRAGYLQLDPGIQPYLVTGTSDDLRGVNDTYYPAGRTPARSHVAASSMTMISVVNGALCGALAAAACVALGGPVLLGILLGAAIGAAYFAAAVYHGYRGYRRFWREYEPRFPAS